MVEPPAEPTPAQMMPAAARDQDELPMSRAEHRLLLETMQRDMMAQTKLIIQDSVQKLESELVAQVDQKFREVRQMIALRNETHN